MLLLILSAYNGGEGLLSSFLIANVISKSLGLVGDSLWKYLFIAFSFSFEVKSAEGSFKFRVVKIPLSSD